MTTPFNVRPESWARISALLDLAFDLDAGQRAALLAKTSAEDAELGAELARLLPGVDSDTSGAIAGFLRAVNPHFKYIELTRHGYLLMDVTPQRVVGEWWYVEAAGSTTNNETFGVALEVQDGANRLQPSAQTPSRANPPPLAP